MHLDLISSRSIGWVAEQVRQCHQGFAGNMVMARAWLISMKSCVEGRIAAGRVGAMERSQKRLSDATTQYAHAQKAVPGALQSAVIISIIIKCWQISTQLWC